jgi:hypothetical protein
VVSLREKLFHCKKKRLKFYFRLFSFKSDILVGFMGYPLQNGGHFRRNAHRALTKRLQEVIMNSD